MHPSITVDRVMNSVNEGHAGLTDPGFCHACGKEVDGVEPDACNYECEFCEEPEVFGAEETLFMMEGF
jgi:hypothetical protein